MTLGNGAKAVTAQKHIIDKKVSLHKPERLENKPPPKLMESDPSLRHLDSNLMSKADESHEPLNKDAVKINKGSNFN